MGYRHYMYAIDKSVVEEIKDMTVDELIKQFMPEDEQDYFYHRNLPTEELYNLGKYIEFAGQIQATGEPLFSRKETREETEDYNFYVIGKEGFLKLIEVYQELIIKYYKSLLVSDNENDYSVLRPRTSVQKLQEHVESMLSEWEFDYAINLSDKIDCITTSWKYEYAIFELARKLKTFDFENKAILFYGW